MSKKTRQGKKDEDCETAEEFMARLEADPEWVARRDRRRAELRAREAESRRLQVPLLTDLRAIGHDLSSVWDLVATATPYPQALPILLEHLQRDYPPGIKDGIARAMAVPDSKFAWPKLVELFINEPVERVKDALAVALSVICDDELLPELIALFKDKSIGSSRVLLFDALRRSKRPEALATLVEMADDPELENEIKPHLKRRARRKKPAKSARKLN